MAESLKFKKNISVTREEVGGDNGRRGEGFSGTTIKDIWTKPRVGEAGEGGGDGWGGEVNTDNCT